MASDPSRSARRGDGTGLVRDVAARVLRRPGTQLDPRQPLTAYGLDSLAAVELQAALAESCGVEVPLERLLEGMTLAELAAELPVGGIAAQPASTGPPAPAGAIPRALSHGQQALWLAHRLAPQSAAYNLVAAGRWRSPLASGALRSAFHSVVESQDALRTIVSAGSEGPRGHVLSADSAPFVESDATAWSDSRLRAELAAEANRPFDLEVQAPIRMRLFRRAPGADVLLLVVDHFASDFWSLAIFARELEQAYRTELDGLGVTEMRPPPARPLRPRASYAEFVAQEEALLAAPAGERLWSYWREELEDAPPFLDLPIDAPRPAADALRGAVRAACWGAELPAALAAIGRQLGATPSAVLLAGFQALLWRHTAQDDFVIGTPAANRASSRFDQTIGYFVNPLPIRARIAGDPAFVQLVAAARRSLSQVVQHQAFPFSVLAQRLRPAREPGRHPVFQVLFCPQRPPPGAPAGISALALGVAGPRLELGALALDPMPVVVHATPFELELHLGEVGGELAAVLRYDADRFAAATADRLLRHLGTLLGAVAEHGSLHLSELPLLAAAERQELLVERQPPATDLPRDGCVHDLVLRQCALTPAAVAASHDGQALSYRELGLRARRLAGRLRGLGVGPEVLVAVALAPSLALPVCLLGILAAGGAYVPLDPTHPAARLNVMLLDCRPRVLLTARRHLSGLAPTGSVVVLVDDLDLAGAPGEEPEPPAAAAVPANLAYLIYTSGSTGRPKAVQVPHQALLNVLAAMAREPGLGSADVLLAVTTLSFDIAALEIFLPLLVGARVALVGGEAAGNPTLLAAALAASGATVMQATPTAWHLLVESGWTGLPGLTALSGGEILSRMLAEHLLARCGRVWNLYGPSETTIWSAASKVASAAGGVPVGTPIANTSIYVLGRHLELLPAGVPGELVIGGEGVARGYHGGAERTAERFLPDPFARGPGARFYRTGDLARWRHGGAIEVLGRLDQQVKVRGVRVEPGEIEAALCRHPGVAAAVVLTRPGRRGEPVLVACLVATPSEPPPGSAEIRGFLRDALPESMLPAAVVNLEALPLTRNGKLDRSRLPAPAWRATAEFVAPRGPVEELLAAIWSEVLDAGQVGAHDDFFELGGHSLKAAQVVQRVRQALGVDLPLRRLFEKPELGELAASVAAALRSDRLPAPPAMPEAGQQAMRGAAAGDDLPLSFGQQQLWLLEQLGDAGASYVMAAVAPLAATLRHAVLARGLQVVVGRHQVLRAGFVNRDGQPRQRCTPVEAWRLPRVDLAGLPRTLRPLEAERLAAAVASRPFDLARAPLLRALVLDRGDGERQLLLAVHHIVADAASIRLFGAEVSTACRALARFAMPELPELPIQYADFAAWQRRTLTGEAIAAPLAHWLSLLAGAPQLALPLDRPRPAVRSPRGGLERRSSGLARGVWQLCQAQRVTPFMALLAASAAVLASYAGQADVTTGVPLAVRDGAATERLIGFFANVLPLRLDLGGEPTGAELLRRARQASLEAYEVRHLPSGMLLEQLRAVDGPSHHALFLVTLAVELEEPAPAAATAGTDLRLRPLHNGTAKSDLGFAAGLVGGQLDLALEYSRDLFDAATARRLLGHLERLVAALAVDPARRVWEIPLLDESERTSVLAHGSGPPARVAVPAGVHRRFECQARQHPAALAVSAPGADLTYQELDRRASRLAHQLRRLGVHPEVLVGVFLERSPDLVVAQLAVLKAGGAYVPIDPGLPGPRVAALLRRAGALALISRGAKAAFAEPVCRVLVDLDAIDPEPSRDTVATPAVDGCVEPGNLAYVIFTSGSTGQPKGVGISHASLDNLVAWHLDEYAVTPADRASHLSGLGFDASVWELWPYLAAGASVHLAPAAAIGSPPALLAWLAARQISLCFLPTPLAEEVLAEPAPLPATLRALLTGGDRLRHASNAGTPAPLVNHYGPTEGAVVATRAVVDHRAGRLPPIGRPISGHRVTLRDRGGRLVPPGAAGELFLAGLGLARGYVGSPELTAASFLPDAYGEPGSRAYRSGDLARWLGDGNLDFLGRADDQVKLRGVRIEPGEVEAALAVHPRVRAVAVKAVSDAPGLPLSRLVAYVAAGPEPPDGRELEESLRRHLPAYLIPSHFVFLPVLPLTASGKIDRARLPEPGRPWLDPASRPVPPRSGLEVALAQVLAELLHREDVGVHDDFFALGGHSLYATQLVSRIRDRFGVELPARAVFDRPTVAGLAVAVTSALVERSEPAAVAAAYAALEP